MVIKIQLSKTMGNFNGTITGYPEYSSILSHGFQANKFPRKILIKMSNSFPDKTIFQHLPPLVKVVFLNLKEAPDC